MPYRLNAYGYSDPGLVRENNEDVWGCLPDHHFYVLADGMGGHQAGEVAAREAVMFICAHMRKQIEKHAAGEMSAGQAIELIRAVIQDTNQFVFELSKTHETLYGMGTTLCTLYFHDDYAIYAHVGDSRIYRFRRHRLEQLTQDHSLISEMLNQGKITVADKNGILYKNIITKAIGTDAEVEPAVHLSIIRPKDCFFMCSDGISDLLSRQEIEGFLGQPYTVEEKVRGLICAAKQKGGFDNITAVLVEVAEYEENIPRQ